MIGLVATMLAAPAPAVIPKLAVIPKASVLQARPAASADATVAQAVVRVRAGDCKGALVLLDPLVAGQPVEGKGPRFAAQMMRMPCLAQAGRAGEVPAVLAELKQAAPDNPLVQGYQVFLDVDGGRYAEAADSLGALAEARSRALTLMPGDLWRTIAQKLSVAQDYARRDRVALALAQAQWQPTDQPDLPDSLAADGIGALLPNGDPDEARVLMRRIARPELLWQMAIERRYAPLWPDIETRLGPAAGAAADRYARGALAAYADGPADDRTTLDAARAFLLLGRYDDAAATAAPVTIHPGMSEQQVSTVLVHGRALAAAGDRRGQIALLAPFAGLDLGTTPNAAVALILLAEAFDDAGRYGEELALAHGAVASGAGFYSPYGLAWLRRSEVCALAGLDRAADAKLAGDALKASAGDNQPAAVEGLLCAGRDAEAARIAIDALGSNEGTDRIADQFQPGAALYAPTPSRLRGLWARLLARPDVRSAFDKSARILPQPLWPAAQPRAVPVLPGTQGGGSTT